MSDLDFFSFKYTRLVTMSLNLVHESCNKSTYLELKSRYLQNIIIYQPCLDILMFHIWSHIHTQENEWRDNNNSNSNNNNCWFWKSCVTQQWNQHGAHKTKEVNLLPLSSRTLYNDSATATSPECSSSVMCLFCFKCLNEAIYTTNTTFPTPCVKSESKKALC